MDWLRGGIKDGDTLGAKGRFVFHSARLALFRQWPFTKLLKANSAVVTWDVLEEEVVIGFAISQQKKDVRMLRFIQEVNTTTRSCSLWDLEEDTEYIVHVQSISIQGQSPASEPVHFKTPREAEKLASKNKGKRKDEVTMKEMGDKNQHLRAGEILIIVVVLFMWAGWWESLRVCERRGRGTPGVIALFCRQYDIIKDNEPNNNKEKAKNTSENSTPEHQSGGLLRSKCSLVICQFVKDEAMLGLMPGKRIGTHFLHSKSTMLVTL
ncbi:Fibronectin type III domain-containing protein 5, partial [Ophiophagus hannah]